MILRSLKKNAKAVVSLASLECSVKSEKEDLKLIWKLSKKLRLLILREDITGFGLMAIAIWNYLNCSN